METQINKTFDDMSDEEKQKLTEKSGKKVIAYVRVNHPGQKAVTKYFLDDGSERIEDDTGKVVSGLPEKEA